MTTAQRQASLRIGFVLTPGMLTTGTALPYEMWLAARDRGCDALSHLLGRDESSPLETRLAPAPRDDRAN